MILAGNWSRNETAVVVEGTWKQTLISYRRAECGRKHISRTSA